MSTNLVSESWWLRISRKKYCNHNLAGRYGGKRFLKMKNHILMLNFLVLVPGLVDPRPHEADSGVYSWELGFATSCH